MAVRQESRCDIVEKGKITCILAKHAVPKYGKLKWRLKKKSEPNGKEKVLVAQTPSSRPDQIGFRLQRSE